MITLNRHNKYQTKRLMKKGASNYPQNKTDTGSHIKFRLERLFYQ